MKPGRLWPRFYSPGRGGSCNRGRIPQQRRQGHDRRRIGRLRKIRCWSTTPECLPQRSRPEANPEEIWDPVLEINSKRTCLDSWRAVPLMQRMGGDSIINLASIIAAVGDGRIFRACWADSIPLYRPRTRPCGLPAIWPLPMPAKTSGSIASAQVMSNRTERSNSPATRRRTRPL